MDILIMSLENREMPINFQFQFMNKKMNLLLTEIIKASHKMLCWIKSILYNTLNQKQSESYGYYI